ncbi:hypothetical protein NMY22_g6081 [Coprinellus aureogranulatus]|nr:hypothetical protein NMY22_g6081 [Coprinellus aureogranulatus]
MQFRRNNGLSGLKNMDRLHKEQSKTNQLMEQFLSAMTRTHPRTDSAAATKDSTSRGKARPEAKKKSNPKTTVEEVTDDEDDYRRDSPRKTSRVIEQPAKGVRFADKEAEVGGTVPRKIPDRPYVMVPPLPASYKKGPLSTQKKSDSKERQPLPSLEKRAPAFKRQAPIEEEESTRRILEELLNAKFTTSLKDLASISPQAREYLRKMITKRKVAVGNKQSDLEYQLTALVDLMTAEKQDQALRMCNLLEEAETEGLDVQEFEGNYMGLEDLPIAQFIVAEGVEGVPDGSYVALDPVEQYLNSLEEGEEPRPILVARESVALRTVYPHIARSGRAEVLLDTGSQICSMDADVARNLGISWDPDVVIHLQSANRSMEKTLGLARNVEFDFGGVLAYIQLHIIRRPAYDVLLGRPFDVAMSSEVSNQVTGEQMITIKDPNTGPEFSRLEDLISEDQGEVGLVIEYDAVTGETYVTHAIKPDAQSFREEELQFAYLQAACTSTDGLDERSRQAVEVLQTHMQELRAGTAKRVLQCVNSEKVVPEGSAQDKKAKAKVKGVSSGTKYKKVADKVKPVLGTLDQKFRIVRNITGDPLKDMPELSTRPMDFEPTGRYTQERMEAMDKAHSGEFLQPEERKLLHEFMMKHNEGFAWDDSERGRFKPEYFPPVEIPTIPHTPWVLKNIPIPPGLYDKVCEIIKQKIDAGVYEPSNSSYRSRWFCVLKKDGESLRLVHSLEPLNAVTIAHSGIPPATEELASKFAGRSCGGCLDLYVGYDERELSPESRDFTTFQTPYGAMRLVTLPMGWTNSVPIFHDDVTYILRDEMPDVTWPFLDDVPVGGPPTRYEQSDGSYETIPENKGIRRFVWEQFERLNRVVQRMKYAGGTFSGKKSILCAEEFVVVGHLCTYEGRKPLPDRVGVIERWGPCETVKDVRAFLGTIGTMRIFIKDFAKRAEPIQRLN